MITRATFIGSMLAFLSLVIAKDKEQCSRFRFHFVDGTVIDADYWEIEVKEDSCSGKGHESCGFKHWKTDDNKGYLVKCTLGQAPIKLPCVIQDVIRIDVLDRGVVCQ